MARGGNRAGAGRPKGTITETPAKQRSIRLTDADYQSFKQLGGAEFLREAIEEALNPTPTEWDRFKQFAFDNRVHNGPQTLLALQTTYEELKFDFGWRAIIEIFHKRGNEM